MARRKDVNWSLPEQHEGFYWDPHVQIALLMDLRDELKQLNRVFACHNAQDIPRILRGIRAKLPTRKRKRKK